MMIELFFYLFDEFSYDLVYLVEYNFSNRFTSSGFIDNTLFAPYPLLILSDCRNLINIIGIICVFVVGTSTPFQVCCMYVYVCM